MNEKENRLIAEGKLADYIFDLTNMEKKAFTLDELFDKHIKDGNDIAANTEKAYFSLKETIKNTETAINKIRTEITLDEDKLRTLKRKKVKSSPIKDIGKILLGTFTSFPRWVIDVLRDALEIIFYIIGGVVLLELTIYFVYTSINNIDITFWGAILSLFIGMPLMVYLISLPISMIKNCFVVFNEKITKKQEAKKSSEALSEAISSNTELLKKLESRLNEDNSKLEPTQKTYEAGKKTKVIYNEQAKKCRESAETIRKNLSTLYAFDVLPAEYRNLSSLLTFEQIFRNDLADNIEQAVKIYKQRESRNMVLAKIDQGYKNLDKVSNEIGSLYSSFFDIRSTVNELIQDARNVSSRMALIEAKDEEIYSEIKTARYAIEAARESQENCESYIRDNY